MDLSKLLALLPEQHGDAYFELRKQRDSDGGTQWVCAHTTITNREIANNIAPTPEEAVRKMLWRLGLLERT